jgi:hypothetical protein
MHNKLQWVSQLLLLLLLGWIGYWVPRESFTQLFILYSLSFIPYLYLIRRTKIKYGIVGYAVLLRVVLLFSLPALSNDYFRFIWDGRMTVLGWNPYLVLPEEFSGTPLMKSVGKDAETLLEGQGSLSPGNYTTYPPLNQVVFIIASWLFPENISGSVVVMRLFLIAAEAGTLFYGRRVLKKLRLPESNILIYALNPMVILEITGNLHFEGLLIFFLVLSLNALLQNQFRWSALWMTFSISIKLIPLIFLPLLLKKTGQRGLITYSLLVFAGSIILFLPFFNIDLISNFFSSIDLYFRKFEFNASIYYLVRWAGYEVYGWNIIQKAGPLLGLTFFVVVLIRSLLARNQDNRVLMESLLGVSTVYYLLATTVHPWYLCLPLFLSLFTRFRFPVVWSWLAFLSYFAYSNPDFQENLVLVALEYAAVLGFFLLERRNLISSGSVFGGMNWRSRRSGSGIL